MPRRRVRRFPLPVFLIAVMLAGVAVVLGFLARPQPEARSPAGDSASNGAAAEPPAQPAIDTASLLSEAQAAQHVGDYQGAVARYRRIKDAAPESTETPEALLQTGVISFRQQRYQDATAVFQRLRQRHPERPQAALATFWLAETQAALGHSSEALSLYEAFAAATPDIADFTRLQRARLLLSGGDAAAAVQEARTAAALTPTTDILRPARRTEAAALAATGDYSGALAVLSDLLDAAESPGVRADLLSALASVQRDMGNSPAWRATLLELVRDHPRTAAADGALDTLLGRFPDAVRPYLEGRVRFYQRRNEAALDAFRRLEAAAPSSGELPWAAYFTAIVYERQGRDTEALAALETALAQYPGSPALEEVLWERSWLLGSFARHSQAAESYQDYRTRYPGSPRAEDAQFFQGLQRYLAGNLRQAVGVWAEGPAFSLHPRRGRTALWRAKASRRLGDTEGASEALAAAQAARPGRYYASRAAELANPGGRIGRSQPLAPPAVTDAEEAAAGQWLNEWGSAAGTLAGAQSRVGQDAHVIRGDMLARMGKNEAALAEYRAAAAAFESQPLRLYALARYLHDNGEYWVSIQAAARLWELAPVQSPAALPRGVLKLLYPVAYWETVQRASRAHGVDPMLLLALMRQESRFTPWVGSGAGALGLTQVMPATGQDIARNLGRADFDRTDLFLPNVSIEFGAYYLARQLAALGGQPEFALAAYNGGAGNALRWMNRDRSIDPDLFVESIDFDETALYVRTVMEDYGIYRMLYGAGG